MHDPSACGSLCVSCELVHYSIIIYTMGSISFYRFNLHFAINSTFGHNFSDACSIFDSLDWTEESYRQFEKIG